MNDDSREMVFITDLDNTVYDFVHVHATAFRTLLHIISKSTGVSEEILKSECTKIAEGYGSLDLQDYVFDLVLRTPKILERGEEFQNTLMKNVRIGFDRTRRKISQALSWNLRGFLAIIGWRCEDSCINKCSLSDFILSH